MSATTTLILIIENLITKVSDDDGALTAALAALKAEVEADESAETALDGRVTTLEQATAPTPFDPTALNDALGALTTRVEALEGAGPASVDLTALTGRLDALEARNAADDQAAAGIVIPGAPVDPTTITLSGLSPVTGTVGQAYAAIISAAGGVAPLSFSVASGALPDGLSLSAGGQISGTFAAAGDFQFSVQAHDANGTVGNGVYDLQVAAAAAQAPAAEAGAEPQPVA